MYPILLHSPSKREIWGGKKIYGMFPEEEYENASELWLLSCREDGESTVKNGSLKDSTVGQVFEELGKRFGGKKYDPFKAFPIFIKLVDAKDSLPIGASTKNRLLYIADAEPDAQMVYGFSRDTSESEIRQRISTNTLFSVCNYSAVKKGDIISIPAGLIHAIGKGILCYEILAGDEEFYPISDYGRTDENGNRLPLMISSALHILDYSAAPSNAARLEDTFLYPFGTVSEFPTDKSLFVSLIRLSGSAGLSENESFISAVITEGSATMSYPSGSVHLKTGDSIVIPAGMNVKFTGYADILCSHL